jgi:DnaJ-class molecular chaperone
MKCSACKGKGRREGNVCLLCMGSGREVSIFDELKSISQPPRIYICDECHGIGKTWSGLSCLRCRGTGKLPACDVCHGTGKVLGSSCSGCHGTGRRSVRPYELQLQLETCPSCHGSTGVWDPFHPGQGMPCPTCGGKGKIPR